MRKAWLLLLLAPSAMIYACGGDDSGTDGGTDAAADTTTKDGSSDTGTTETGSDAAADAGNDVTVTITCLKPANCIDGGDQDAAYPPDSGEVCCGTVMGNGNQQSCQINGASTACSAPSACATDFSGLAACTSATVRFCTTNAECTETSGNPTKDGSKCCTANGGDAGTFKICANSTIATLSGGKITCN